MDCNYRRKKITYRTKFDLLEWAYVNHKKLNKISTIAEPLNLQGDSRYLRQNSSPTNVIRG